MIVQLGHFSAISNTLSISSEVIIPPVGLFGLINTSSLTFSFILDSKSSKSIDQFSSDFKRYSTVVPPYN